MAAYYENRIAQRLRELRKQKVFSLADLGKLLGLH
jgi:hypothetical protein